ncbi:MAG: hydrogenase [Deltaproteobacteria bacterium]|nr:hydrogenase [Deltaproteobacteria bacterium]
MNAAHLVLAGSIGMALSGVPALVFGTRARAGRLGSTALHALAALAVLVGAALALGAATPPAIAADWSLPFGRFAVEVDTASAIFLLPIAVVPVLGIVYGHGYIDADHARWSPAATVRLRLFYGLIAGAMVMLVIARDSILFLLAWEVMALASFFLITADDRDPAARGAGWIYLVATHVGTLALFAFFALLASARGDTSLSPSPDALAPGDVAALFALGLVGFGLKAGLMPLHVWLPPAHAAAPSHVSAVLSGVVTKMGVYGLVRTLIVLPELPSTYGLVLIGLGAVSAVAAIVMAIGQTDLKRLLAYSTIENIGVITTGLGLAVLGRALGRGELVALGLGGALLHTLGHALFKPMLFFGAGALIHATGTRSLDRMGGLARVMPRTAMLFALGAVAICALPPLSGFASELLVYLGAFDAVASDAPGFAGLVAPALALTGALAVACFVRAFGAAFLGEPRTPEAAHAHEAPRVMHVPMLVLGALVTLIGVLPWLVTPLLDAAARAFSPGLAAPALTDVAPLVTLTGVGVGLGLAVALAFWLLLRRVRRRAPPTAAATVGTWDCGYAAPSARMQYTASSFGALVVGLFPWLLFPRTKRPTIDGPFPAPSDFRHEVPDVVLDAVVMPAGDRAERQLSRVRILQHGSLHIYILYILVVVIALFLWLGM